TEATVGHPFGQDVRAFQQQVHGVLDVLSYPTRLLLSLPSRPADRRGEATGPESTNSVDASSGPCLAAVPYGCSRTVFTEN
ncbi:hypothetical protein, partial [Streptomyces sp. SID1328]|uniref:hypothetical protein n=1 Tax=Streptomyces sp. SID1328 TaxID=2690250 RepID=UPI001F456F3C